MFPVYSVTYVPGCSPLDRLHVGRLRKEESHQDEHKEYRPDDDAEYVESRELVVAVDIRHKSGVEAIH